MRDITDDPDFFDPDADYRKMVRREIEIERQKINREFLEEKEWIEKNFK